MPFGATCEDRHMTVAEPAPTEAQARTVEAFAEALYELLQGRALSLGVVDIALEVDGWFVDVELMFATGPDMGASVHVGVGEARFCELVGADDERWLEHEIAGLVVLAASTSEDLAAQALLVLQGVLDARRPLLTKA
ncbi:MAG: hypothetical protein JWN41_535 [Thermoleophilia bacterium]|nr:hypothetical protein [Thermoleophilia bacterium]